MMNRQSIRVLPEHPAGAQLHPTWIVIECAPGLTSLVDRALIPAVARTLPPPTPAHRRCPSWVASGPVHNQRMHQSMPRLRRIHPDGWDELLRVCHTWRVQVIDERKGAAA